MRATSPIFELTLAASTELLGRDAHLRHIEGYSTLQIKYQAMRATSEARCYSGELNVRLWSARSLTRSARTRNDAESRAPPSHHISLSVAPFGFATSYAILKLPAVVHLAKMHLSSRLSKSSMDRCSRSLVPAASGMTISAIC